MSFMKPEIWQEQHYTVETSHGTEIIPVSVCGILPETEEEWTEEELESHFGDYCFGDIYSAELSSGWLYRLSAPGYLDTYGCGEEPEDWEEELIDRLKEIESSDSSR